MRAGPGCRPRCHRGDIDSHNKERNDKTTTRESDDHDDGSRDFNTGQQRNPVRKPMYFRGRSMNQPPRPACTGCVRYTLPLGFKKRDCEPDPKKGNDYRSNRAKVQHDSQRDNQPPRPAYKGCGRTHIGSYRYWIRHEEEKGVLVAPLTLFIST